MKKTYYKTITETIVIEAMGTLCDSVPNGGTTGDPGDPNAAPGKRVF